MGRPARPVAAVAAAAAAVMPTASAAAHSATHRPSRRPVPATSLTGHLLGQDLRPRRAIAGPENSASPKTKPKSYQFPLLSTS